MAIWATTRTVEKITGMNSAVIKPCIAFAFPR